MSKILGSADYYWRGLTFQRFYVRMNAKITKESNIYKHLIYKDSIHIPHAIYTQYIYIYLHI